MIMWPLSLILLYSLICIEPSLHPWNGKTTWSWCIKLTEFGLQIFYWGFLYLCSSRKLVCSFLLCCCVCIWFLVSW
jgi:hypothetical protein